MRRAGMTKMHAMTTMPSKDAVALLKEDHRKVEGLFAEFESARTKVKKGKLINEIVKELSVHATLEEKLVYPVLMGCEEEGTEEAYEEHHVVKLILAELADYDGSEENAKAKVKVLSELIKHHVEEEENELLPMLEESGEDLQVLGQKMIKQKERLLSGVKTIGDKSKRQVGGAPARSKRSSTRKAS
jgi:hemerythrin superfamily protein